MTRYARTTTNSRQQSRRHYAKETQVGDFNDTPSLSYRENNILFSGRRHNASGERSSSRQRNNRRGIVVHARTHKTHKQTSTHVPHDCKTTEYKRCVTVTSERTAVSVCCCFSRLFTSRCMPSAVVDGRLFGVPALPRNVFTVVEAVDIAG